jgi:hypothetical protein
MTFGLAFLVAFAAFASVCVVIALVLGVPTYRRLREIRRRERLIETLAALDQVK